MPETKIRWDIRTGPPEALNAQKPFVRFLAFNQHAHEEQRLVINLELVIGPDERGAFTFEGRMEFEGRRVQVTGSYSHTDDKNPGWIQIM